MVNALSAAGSTDVYHFLVVLCTYIFRHSTYAQLHARTVARTLLQRLGTFISCLHLPILYQNIIQALSHYFLTYIIYTLFTPYFTSFMIKYINISFHLNWSINISVISLAEIDSDLDLHINNIQLNLFVRKSEIITWKIKQVDLRSEDIENLDRNTRKGLKPRSTFIETASAQFHWSIRRLRVYFEIIIPTCQRTQRSHNTSLLYQ